MTDRKFSEWCNYRSRVTKIILGNRGADNGFNLYFDAAQEPNEPDVRTLGLQLTWEQAYALRKLIDEGLNNYNKDNLETSGGTYCYPPEEVKQEQPAPSPRKYHFTKNPALGVVAAQRPSVTRLLYELINLYNFTLQEGYSKEETKQRMKVVFCDWIDDLMAAEPEQ